MGSYVVLTCDVAGVGCVESDGDAPDGKTLALARKAAKRAGWLLTGRDGAVCYVCRKSLRQGKDNPNA